MKPLKRKLASSLALFVLLSTAQLASAFYDPSLGRWLNRDPLAEPSFEVLRHGTPGVRPDLNVSTDGPNLYTFVHNESVNGVDALGLNKCDDKNTAQGKPPLGCTKWKSFLGMCCRTCIRDFPKEEGDPRPLPPIGPVCECVW